KTYVIVSGQGASGINFFVYGLSEQRWVTEVANPNYADMRHWLLLNNVLYGAVFKPNGVGGALLRYAGSFANLPTPNPNAGNGYVALPFCGPCLVFQDVGDFDTPASDVVLAPAGTADAGRIFVGTWASTDRSHLTNAACGIFM